MNPVAQYRVVVLFMGSLEIPIDRPLKSHVIRSRIFLYVEKTLENFRKICTYGDGDDCLENDFFHFDFWDEKCLFLNIYSIQQVGRMVMMTKMKKTRLALATNSLSTSLYNPFLYVLFFKTNKTKNNLDWRVFTNSARIAFQLTLNWETPYFLAFSSFTKTNQIFIFVCWTSKVGYSFVKDAKKCR